MVASASTPYKPAKTGGDDLDDGLDLDADFAASGDEDEAFSEDEHSGAGRLVTDADVDLEGEGDVPVLEDLDTPEGVKRKRSAGDNGNGEDEEEVVDEEERKRRKKVKAKEKFKMKKALRNAADPTALSTPGTYLPTSTLLSMLTSSLLASNPSLTSLETSAILPPTDSLLPPPEHKVDPTLTIDSLEPVKRRIAGLLKKNGKVVPGKPRVILLCLSGIRCADVVREVRSVKEDSHVAKLFAKHMKAHEQAEFLAKNKVSIAVGTPARVGKLLADGALQVDKSTIMLLDLGHKDPKTRTILTLPEVREELWRSIFQGEARKALLEGGARIGAF